MRVGVGVGWGFGWGYRYPAPLRVYHSVQVNPYYVARAPLVVDTTYTPQYYVREEPTGTAVAEKVEVVKLKPGESIQNGGVVITNIDGKLVILQAVKDNGSE